MSAFTLRHLPPPASRATYRSRACVSIPLHRNSARPVAVCSTSPFPALGTAGRSPSPLMPMCTFHSPAGLSAFGRPAAAAAPPAAHAVGAPRVPPSRPSQPPMVLVASVRRRTHEPAPVLLPSRSVGVVPHTRVAAIAMCSSPTSSRAAFMARFLRVAASPIAMWATNVVAVHPSPCPPSPPPCPPPPPPPAPPPSPPCRRRGPLCSKAAVAFVVGLSVLVVSPPSLSAVGACALPRHPSVWRLLARGGVVSPLSPMPLGVADLLVATLYRRRHLHTT